MLGGASLFASCDKEDEPMHDVELVFLENSLENNLDPRLEWNEFIKLVADPKVNNIYIRAHERNNYERQSISDICANILTTVFVWHHPVFMAVET